MPSDSSDVTVVKMGGALMERPAALAAFWEGVQRLRAATAVVVVHGGGAQATDLARRLGHEPRIVQGRRVTTDLDLDLALWTMRGAVNARLVAQGQAAGVPTAGISGADGALLRVARRPPWQIGGDTVDFGWVGDVERVEPRLVQVLLGSGFVPVVAPLGIGAEGQLYNVNADTVACALAGALRARAFLLVAESGGLRRDPDDPASLLTRCDAGTYRRGLDDGWIRGGMIVKLTVAFEALRAGIPEVAICAPDDLATRTRATRIEEGGVDDDPG